jgi:UDP-N-acetylglucosamine--N-acetylmuramyl-(pentapeptide) pyrophosphoryl-undecaprenol N-acetylglucosamine transferase
MPYPFVLAGGGTGGHIYPALAVAQVLRDRGHQPIFIGTSDGMESRIVPEHGYQIRFVRSAGLKRVGLRRQVGSLVQLPIGIAVALRTLRELGARAVFSMGGYVAGPVMIAATLAQIPVIVMEPNAVPGFANRKIASYVYRALLGFETTRSYFPSSRCEVTGLPVRPDFFHVQPKMEGPFTVLVTGGSRGSRTLNRASRESWPLFKENASGIRFIHQTGPHEYDTLAAEFTQSGVPGEITPFIAEMAWAFASADLVVARAGAGSVNEIAAAGMPALLVPFPFASDDHQRLNAETLMNAGAARMILDSEMNGQRFFEEVERLRKDRMQLEKMRARVRQFAKPGAATRAADVLEEAAQANRASG